MRVVCRHEDVQILSDDLASVGPRLYREGNKVVRANVRAGLLAAQAHAKALSGRHGKAYWKRITSDMTGPLTGEWGPHDGGTPVGAGYRDGPPNTDMQASLDVVGPRFAHDIDDMLSHLFDKGAR